MAEEPDAESKTEAPSEKKIQDALDKGNVPFSRETVMFASLLAMLIAMSGLMPAAVSSIALALLPPIENPGGLSLATPGDAVRIGQTLAGPVFAALAPVLGLFMVFGLAASLGQNTPRLVLHRIKPDPSRLSLAKGWKRIFGVQGFVEFLKSVFKLVAIAMVAAITLVGLKADIAGTLFLPPAGLPEATRATSFALLSALAVGAAVLAAADFSWSRHHWHQRLRMTREEVKTEHKQAEGDPLVRARVRAVARERSRKRMLAQVPLATLVLANPTHYSVALRYEPERDAAPVVLAKGRDLVALRIREVAEQHDVPVIEDRALARSLHAAVEVDQLIPPEFYRAVAEIVLFLSAASRSGRPISKRLR